MAGTLNELAEPDESNQPSGEVRVVVTIPEEFTGISHHQLIAHGGLIADMTTHDQSVTVYASLPASNYRALVEAIMMNAQGRGTIEPKG